tara:strand:- start:7 stop:858 length:852 start_codon:yes stop_codon:yes gene_type:complete
MPGYWNRPASGQQERQEPRSWSGDYGQQEDRSQDQGGGNAQEEQRRRAEEQRRQEAIKRQSEEAAQRYKEQQAIDARNAAQAASQALHAQQMQEMARDMKAVGQISGGLSGGTYTKGPVVYPKSFYTHEGWAEVQQRGWSDKLVDHEIQGKTPSEWILSADDPEQAGGKLRDLDEGVIYSSNIGSWDEDQRGYGGFKRVSNFTGDSRDGGLGGLGGYSGMWRSGYGGGYGGSGYAAGMPYIPGAQEGMGYSEPSFTTDPMQAWMVGVNTPQYAARGGIMSLRR